MQNNPAPASTRGAKRAKQCARRLEVVERFDLFPHEGGGPAAGRVESCLQAKGEGGRCRDGEVMEPAHAGEGKVGETQRDQDVFTAELGLARQGQAEEPQDSQRREVAGAEFEIGRGQFLGHSVQIVESRVEAVTKGVHEGFEMLRMKEAHEHKADDERPQQSNGSAAAGVLGPTPHVPCLCDDSQPHNEGQEDVSPV